MLMTAVWLQRHEKLMAVGVGPLTAEEEAYDSEWRTHYRGGSSL